MACLALLAASGIHAPAAHAAFYTGDQVYALCTAERGSSGFVEKTYECIAYVTGAVDAFNTVREASKLKRCIPPDVTIDRLRIVTVDYLRDHPETLNGSASNLVFAAINKTWPCAMPAPEKPVRKTRRRS